MYVHRLGECYKFLDLLIWSPKQTQGAQIMCLPHPVKSNKWKGWIQSRKHMNCQFSQHITFSESIPKYSLLWTSRLQHFCTVHIASQLFPPQLSNNVNHIILVISPFIYLCTSATRVTSHHYLLICKPLRSTLPILHVAIIHFHPSRGFFHLF